MFKKLDKGTIITFSHGLYRECTRYCEVLVTNVFPICQYSPNIRQYSSLFANFCHLSPLFVTICNYSDNSSLFVTVRLYSQLFATIRHYSPLFATIYSPLFAAIRHYSWLFVTIRDYSYYFPFAIRDYSLFGFSRHPISEHIETINIKKILRYLQSK